MLAGTSTDRTVATGSSTATPGRTHCSSPFPSSTGGGTASRALSPLLSRARALTIEAGYWIGGEEPLPIFGLYDTLARMRSALPWQASQGATAQERHRGGGGDTLRNVVFGANDGLVSNVSLVAAVAGATAESKTILLGGLAGLVAGALSMALGAYISTKSEQEFRESEERRERWEIEHTPHEELGEIRQIYRRKGLRGPLLDTVVEQLTQDKEQWLQLMMSEELGFGGHAPRPHWSALVMGLAFVVGAAVPVISYLFIEGLAALLTSLGLTAAALLVVGAWRAYLTGNSVWRKAAEMVVLAAVAVGAANLIGRLVGIGID